MIWDDGIHARRPHPCLCHIQRHILAVKIAVKPLYFNGFRRLSKITKMSHRRILNTVERRNWLCGIFQLRAALDIMLQGHCRCSVACRRLRLFYILCNFIDVCQHGCSESARRNVFLKSNRLIFGRYWMLCKDNAFLRA